MERQSHESAARDVSGNERVAREAGRFRLDEAENRPMPLLARVPRHVPEQRVAKGSVAPIERFPSGCTSATSAAQRYVRASFRSLPMKFDRPPPAVRGCANGLRRSRRGRGGSRARDRARRRGSRRRRRARRAHGDPRRRGRRGGAPVTVSSRRVRGKGTSRRRSHASRSRGDDERAQGAHVGGGGSVSLAPAGGFGTFDEFFET